MTSTAVDFSGASATDMSRLDTARRLDTRRRLIVDDGIALQRSSNTMSAVEYLRRHGIGAHVIERVLLEPLRRRSTL